MTIKQLDISNTHIFGFSVEGKLTAEEFDTLLPELEAAIKEADNKLRLLVQVEKMDHADLHSEWEAFEFLRKHVADIELIAIVGAHSWTKVMSEILAASIFVEADTQYFKASELDEAREWLQTQAHPSHIPMRKVITSPDGAFTKYSSPNYM